MKKLIIAITAIAAAFAVNAGTVTWSSGTLESAGMGGVFSGEQVGNGAVSGYLFILSSDEYDTFADTYASSGYSAMSESVYDTYKDSLASAKATGTTLGGNINLTDGKSYANNAMVYAALIYTMTQDEKDYYIANIGDYKAKTSAKTAYDSALYELGSDTLSGTETPITGWTPIGGGPEPEPPVTPEPTSGLLLGLGMAGLALRRKMAK